MNDAIGQAWCPDPEACIRVRRLARARQFGIPKREGYAIVHDRLGKRVSSLKQLGEQILKKLYNIMMAMER